MNFGKKNSARVSSNDVLKKTKKNFQCYVITSQNRRLSRLSKGF